jgi:hypothetical protein
MAKNFTNLLLFAIVAKSLTLIVHEKYFKLSVKWSRFLRQSVQNIIRLVKLLTGSLSRMSSKSGNRRAGT